MCTHTQLQTEDSQHPFAEVLPGATRDSGFCLGIYAQQMCPHTLLYYTILTTRTFSSSSGVSSSCCPMHSASLQPQARRFTHPWVCVMSRAGGEGVPASQLGVATIQSVTDGIYTCRQLPTAWGNLCNKQSGVVRHATF